MRISLLPLLFFTTIFFSAIPADTYSQDSLRTENQGFGLRAAGLSAGWYKPSMDYWNKEYFADTSHRWENSFKGNLILSGHLELGIISNLSARAGFSFWKEKVESGIIPVGETTGTEELTTRLTFLSVDLVYRPDFLRFAGFGPYAGAGGSFLLVRNTLLRTPRDYDAELYEKKGQDITAAVTTGIERRFGQRIAAAIEFRYHIGNYTQEMEERQSPVTSHAVSIAGPQIGLNLTYLFR